MTIGELEAALGMPRANIRFYEQEGFIHPRRGANNYRDYTEEDADTLRKVKLLRQLGLSLEEIRQAQRGERPLAALLGEQEAALARRRAELDWAGQVCRAMREDGVEFATLDAHRYLSRLDRPADQPGFFDLRADAAPTVSHPGAISPAAWTTAFAAFYGWWCACSCSAGFLRTTGESGC